MERARSWSTSAEAVRTRYSPENWARAHAAALPAPTAAATGFAAPGKPLPVDQSSMDRNTNLCRFVITDDKPTLAIGLVQNGHGETHAEATLPRLDATLRDPGSTPK